MNKIKNILNNSIDVKKEKNLFIGYVKSYPEATIKDGEIMFSIPFSNDRDIVYRAVPLDPKSFTFPVVGQLVLIILIESFFYYCGYFQLSKSQNADFLLEYIDEKNSGVYDAKNDFENGTKKIFPMYDEIPQIEKLVGETFVNGNANNNIILGYDQKGDPKISIIQNRESEEYDLNTSGVHLRTNTKITDEVEYPKSTNIEDSESDFLLLTEDILNLVSKVGSIIITSNDKIILNSLHEIYISSDANINISSPDNDITIEGNNVFIGKGNREPLVLGDTLKSLLEELIGNLDTFYQNVISGGPASLQTGFNTLVPFAAQQKAKLQVTKNKLSNILSSNETS